jgi:hypothetical protein
LLNIDDRQSACIAMLPMTKGSAAGSRCNREV